MVLRRPNLGFSGPVLAPADGIRIRDVQKRKAKQELEAKLLEGLMSGPAEPMTREDWEALEKEVLDRIAREQDGAEP